MIRVHMEVRGIVQGVGFRPFIHREVKKRDLRGWIRNTSSGVEMELEGTKEAMDSFAAAIREESPSLAMIEAVEMTCMDGLAGYPGFEIIESQTQSQRRTLVSPDVCTCQDCLRELMDPADRRFRYPFINCTNCGPRFTIIRDVPYDRKKTSMRGFPMCKRCADEYGDIENRRYHAQPDCCPDCGPTLFFVDAQGNQAEGDPVEHAIGCLKAGGIVAVKGLGGFHLACRTDDSSLAAALRSRKGRDEKPFAIMCADIREAKRYGRMTPAAEKLLTSRQRPIVLLEKREKDTLAHISENGYVGVMLPYTPVHFLLLSGEIKSLIMTSANLSDQPILHTNEAAMAGLQGVADGFLMHDRDIHVCCDDSLMWVWGNDPYFVRRSRGYAPLPLRVPGLTKKILACGAEQKATFSLSKDGYLFPSQHIGDLKNLETMEHYEQQAAHFQRIFDIKPDLIACDLHPDYMSTAYAESRAKMEGLPLIRVQHHHAHMASCMADNELDGPCIGIVWDGTGHGTDGRAWGGEFLTGGYDSFVRRGSIRPLRLPGGDRAVREIWRIGCALKADAGLADDSEPMKMVKTILRMNLNCPETTSIGRLFDGVSAILGIREKTTYEGQGAILLETAAQTDEGTYPYTIVREGDMYVFDYRPMIRALAAETDRGLGAARFMNTLVDMAVRMCEAIRQDTGLEHVVLSGGTFQNMYVLKRLTKRLKDAGFMAYTHKRVSTNDEGLSLGQAMIAERGGGEYVPGNSLENH